MAKKKYKVIERTRRENGTGSIYLQKNGQWTGKIWLTDPKTHERTRKSVYGHSENEVKDKIIKLTGSMSVLNSNKLTHKTFGDLFEEWLLIFKKSTVSPRTFEGNMRNFKLHIRPYVDNMDISEVTAPVIQQVINEMLMKENSVNLARKAKFLFNQFFEYAVDCGYVEYNPVNRVKVRTKLNNVFELDNTYKAIEKDDRMRFLEALNQHELLKPLCMTMMFAGLRCGETLALRWQNIDFENKTIQVRNGIIIVPKFDEKGNVISRKTVIGPTKTTCSVREVPIPDILVEALKDWKKCQWVRKELTGVDLLAPNAIVFCNNDGTVRTYSGTRVMFSKFLKRIGMKNCGIHFHTLRHTYSNILFEMNENPKIIQALLGHKSVKTTLMVYNSVDKSYYKQATEKLNNMFNKDKMKEYQELTQKKDIPALKRDMEEIDNELDEDPEIAMLQRLIAEKKARKKQKDNDEEM